jgi:uncharacterized integral membrane protein
VVGEEHDRREGPRWKLWVALVALVLFLIFVAQNSREEEIDFLFATVTTPLFFALLVAGALGAVIGWLAPRVWRRD